MRFFARTLLGIAAMASILAGCSNSETGQAESVPSTTTTATTTTTTITTTETTTTTEATTTTESAAPAPTESVVLDCTRQPQVKPAEVILFCGDGNAYVDGISWTDWATQTASGTGTLNANDCKPDCAGGTFTQTPVTIDLSAPVGSDSHFTVATVTYPDGHTQTYRV